MNGQVGSQVRNIHVFHLYARVCFKFYKGLQATEFLYIKGGAHSFLDLGMPVWNSMGKFLQ